jgi:rhodanese-related sulfurtransferase
MLDTWKGLEVLSGGAEPRRVRANRRPVEEIRSIEPADLIALRKRHGDKVVVVDVRNSPKEMLRSTLPDAQVLSVEELEVRWRQLPQGATIVVYCWDQWSTLSARAVHLLTLRGLKAIADSHRDHVGQVVLALRSVVAQRGEVTAQRFRRQHHHAGVALADAALRDEVLDLLVATLRRLYPEPSAALLPASR